MLVLYQHRNKFNNLNKLRKLKMFRLPLPLNQKRPVASKEARLSQSWTDSRRVAGQRQRITAVDVFHCCLFQISHKDLLLLLLLFSVTFLIACRLFAF